MVPPLPTKARRSSWLVILSFVFFVPYTLVTWYLTSLFVGVGLSVTEAALNYAVLLSGYAILAPAASFAAEALDVRDKALRWALLGSAAATGGLWLFCARGHHSFGTSLIATLGIAATYPAGAAMLNATCLDAAPDVCYGHVRAAMNLGGATSALVVLLAVFIRGKLTWTSPSSVDAGLSTAVAGLAFCIAIAFTLTPTIRGKNKDVVVEKVPLEMEMEPPPDEAALSRLRRLGRNVTGELWAFYVLLLLLGCATKAFDAFVVAFLVTVEDVSVVQLALALGIEMSSATVTNLVWDLTAIDKEKTLFVVCAAAFARVALVAVRPGLSLILVSQGIAGMWWPLLNLVTQDFAHAEAPAGLGTTAVAVSQAVYVGLGGFSGSVLGTVIQARFGWTALFRGALLAALGAVAVAVALVFKIPRLVRSKYPAASEARPLLSPKKKNSAVVVPGDYQAILLDDRLSWTTSTDLS